ncbi:MAG: hypothetical protein Tsb004_12820 [Allomuricauda sp.]
MSTRKKICLSLLFLISISSYAQEPTTDFSKIDNVVNTLYNVISGPAGERDWSLFRSLFHEKALMGSTGFTREGNRAFGYFTPEGYIERNAPFFKERGFYEEELERITNKYGGIAQVFTSYQFRFEEKGEVVQRGVNSIQLIYEKDRWYITQLFWEGESEKVPLQSLKK